MVTGTARKKWRVLYNSIQILTGVMVIIENFGPKVCKMLLEIEDRGQHVMN